MPIDWNLPAIRHACTLSGVWRVYGLQSTIARCFSVLPGKERFGLQGKIGGKKIGVAPFQLAEMIRGNSSVMV